MHIFKNIYCSKMAILLTKIILVLMVVGVQAQDQSDVGMVTRLIGKVSYHNPMEGEQVRQVKLFMKVRHGDQLEIPQESLIQIIYYTIGRQETWRGPATIIVKDLKSQAKDEDKLITQPEIKDIPSDVTEKIRNPIISLHNSFSRYSGVTRIRGIKECSEPKSSCTRGEAQEHIDKANKIYQLLRQQTSQDDVTPELYLINVLAEYQRYQEIQQLIRQMLIKQPNNPTLNDLMEWVRSISSKMKPIK